MAPIRRYLRITKYSVIEVRIYLDKPSDAAWLLSPRDPVLARVMQAVRPKILPKLREESIANASASGKRKAAAARKKKGIKDIAEQDDFVVSIFLKDSTSRHSLLTKDKTFQNKPRLASTSHKLTGWLGNANTAQPAIRIDDDAQAEPAILREESGDDDVIEISKIPEAGSSKGRKRTVIQDQSDAEGSGDENNDALFVSSSDEDFFQTQRAQTKATKRMRKRQRNDSSSLQEQEGIGSGGPAIETDDHSGVDHDDKKKLGLKTTYGGFSIYGRVLCLIVRRKAPQRDTSRSEALASAAAIGGSQMMEQWVSTQAGQADDAEDET